MNSVVEQSALAAKLPRRSVVTGGCLVAILFCFPLFVGLDRLDLRSDEAIYAYAINRTLETGEWLTPRSIRIDGPFLEKPPLKIWMTAALIETGVLARNETGYRALDAVFGATALMYVYAMGVRLAGVLSGIAAVLILFTLDSLLFQHGLRSSNMEAALFLSYAGGIYHFMAWVPAKRRQALLHIAAVTLYFVLGFMTKFVAVLFLPAICLAGAASGPVRVRAKEDWQKWCVASVAAILAIAPWFMFETALYGQLFWSVILGDHVFTRFTRSLDPSHIQPWYYYFEATWSEMARAGSRLAGTFGAMFLLWRGLRGDFRWRLLAAWWAVPFLFMSLGTSKLIHYAYPFWPPIALAVGCLAERIWAAGAPSSAAARGSSWLSSRTMAGKGVRTGFALAAVVAFVVAAETALYGRITWEVGGFTVFRNSSVERPAVLAAIFLCSAVPARLSGRLIACLVLVFLLPVSGYPEQIVGLYERDRRLSSLRDCIDQSSPTGIQASVLDTTNSFDNHSYYFYLYRLGNWIERPDADPELILSHLSEGTSGPALVSRESLARLRSRGVPLNGVSIDGNIVLLPQRFARCAHESVIAGGSRVSY